MTWLIPMLITLACFGWSVWKISTAKTSGDYGMIGAALGLFVLLMFSVIVSLIAWLVWAVLS